MAAGPIDGGIAAAEGGLVQRLRLRPAGRDRFLGWAPQAPPRIYGGELAAQALAAANATVDTDRVAHVLQCTYLAAGRPDSALEYEVARVRDGRSFSTRTVEVYNAERMVLTATVGYHVAATGFTHQLAMPDAAPPGDLLSIADADGNAWTRWAEQDPDIEMCVVPADVSDPLGRRQFWCRVVGPQNGSLSENTALATYLSDFTMVASIRLPHEPQTAKQYLMTTLSHTVYFHRPVRASEWHLIDHYSPVAAAGRGLALSHTYHQCGELVMTAAQEGLIRPLPDDYDT